MPGDIIYFFPILTKQTEYFLSVNYIFGLKGKTTVLCLELWSNLSRRDISFFFFLSVSPVCFNHQQLKQYIFFLTRCADYCIIRVRQTFFFFFLGGAFAVFVTK